MSKGIALYARVSSDRQAQEGTIESQVSVLKTHAASRGLNVDADLVFADNGVSGATLARPALDRLRDKVLTGHVDTVLIHNPDRLARKHAHQLILVEEFHKLGAKIVFANRTISSSPEDQLLLQIQGVIAEYEREKIIERHRRGKLHKAQQGHVSVLSCAPYGYVYVRKTEQRDARYEIDVAEAKVVRQIFDMFCFKRASIRAIAKKLTKERVPSRNDVGHWEPSVVWGILRNPAYFGRAAYRKTKLVPHERPTKLARDRGGYPKHSLSSSRQRPQEEWIPITVPAIVDEKTFLIAAQQLEENKRLSPRNNTRHQYLLSGLLHCKECGYSIYGSVSSSRYRRAYYRCMGQDGYRWPHGRICGGHPVRVEALDDLVWDQTKRLIQEPQVTLTEYNRRRRGRGRRGAPVKDLIKQKKAHVKALEAEKQRLLDLYQRGSIQLKEVESRLAKIRTKIQNTLDEQRLLERATQEKNAELALVESFEVFAKKLAVRLDTLCFEEKKEVTRLLVTEVIVDTKAEELTIKHVIPGEKVCQLRSRRIGAPNQ